MDYIDIDAPEVINLILLPPAPEKGKCCETKGVGLKFWKVSVWDWSHDLAVCKLVLDPTKFSEGRNSNLPWQ